MTETSIDQWKNLAQLGPQPQKLPLTLDHNLLPSADPELTLVTEAMEPWAASDEAIV